MQTLGKLLSQIEDKIFSKLKGLSGKNSFLGCRNNYQDDCFNYMEDER